VKASTPTGHLDNEPFYGDHGFQAAGKLHRPEDGCCDNTIYGCDPFCPHGEAARKDQEFFNHAREDVLALVGRMLLL
jgi:hypothetical protein